MMIVTFLGVLVEKSPLDFTVKRVASLILFFASLN